VCGHALGERAAPRRWWWTALRGRLRLPRHRGGCIGRGRWHGGGVRDTAETVARRSIRTVGWW
jgi:hypothetical protein